MCLLCVIDGFGLAQDVNLYLTRVSQLVLDLLCDVAGKQNHLILADLFGLDHDADLAAGLNRVGACDAGDAPVSQDA